MKKTTFLVLGILILATFAFAIQITFYKWNATTSGWVVVSVTATARATANSTFTTGTFVPLSKNWWNPARINWSISIPQSFVGTTSFNGNLRTHIYGKWVTDDVFIMFRSNDKLNVSYSVKGTNTKGNSAYYQAKMDNNSAPSSNFKEWNKVGKQSETSNIRVNAGNHSFHLWWGFDIAKNRNGAFSGMIIFFDTYIVPDI